MLAEFFQYGRIYSCLSWNLFWLLVKKVIFTNTMNDNQALVMLLDGHYVTFIGNQWDNLAWWLGLLLSAGPSHASLYEGMYNASSHTRRVWQDVCGLKDWTFFYFPLHSDDGGCCHGMEQVSCSRILRTAPIEHATFSHVFRSIKPSLSKDGNYKSQLKPQVATYWRAAYTRTWPCRGILNWDEDYVTDI